MKDSRPKSKAAEMRQRRKTGKQRQTWMRWGLLALGVIALGAAFFWPRVSAKPLSPERLAADPEIGPASAPVTIIEYSDFG
jgi:hypothetical protein